MTTQPMLIRGGQAYPITASQYAAARRFQSISPVAGLASPARPQVAAPTPPVPPAPRVDGRASMLKEIGRKYGADAKATAEANPGFRRRDVDPKAAAVPGPVTSRSDGAPANARARSKASMLKQVERMGGAVR